MGMIEYCSSGTVTWKTLVEFVLPNALSEGFQSYRRVERSRKLLKNTLLFLVWMWSCFIVIRSYAGNLTSFITAPKFGFDFDTPEDVLNQCEITPVIREGSFLISAASHLPQNSAIKILINNAELLSAKDHWSSPCFTSGTQFTREHASICGNYAIKYTMSDDYSKYGRCNWYTTKSSFFFLFGSMILQVHIIKIKKDFL